MSSPLRPTVLIALTLALAAADGASAQATEASSPDGAKKLEPGDAINYESLAFYPDRWKKRGIPLEMYPWRGEETVLLTTSKDFDGEVMAGFVDKLDAGWRLYSKLTGRLPRRYKHLGGKPTFAAVPDFSLTCGYGCGMVGATGIEVGAFYRKDYQDVRNDPAAVPDYYFYEMGRNFYTFGDRHAAQTTGFAVFMRYVCVDHLKLKTDVALRKTIEQAEGIYRKSDVPFLRAFTTLDGLSEKQNRLRDANGKTISPTDQPVMYASAMLRLRKELGGDEWVQRFFYHLRQCPAVRIDAKSPTAKEAGLKQSMNWFVAASCAARTDLTGIFADQWRMPLTDQQRERMQAVDWTAEGLDAGDVLSTVLSVD